MRIITKEQLAEVLDKHKKWIKNEETGIRADLYGANLYGADLSRADLSRADLSGADLSGANLYGADLSRADLSRANLYGADLSGANLSGANLSGANLYGANLYGADLYGADLYGADLYGAKNVNEVRWNEMTAFFSIVCPEEGSFIGWKKAGGHIVKLRITEDAKRSSATTRKCRCSKAEVLAIETVNGEASKITEIRSDRDSGFVYRVNEIVEVPDFDNDRWNECSTGIHFFITRAEAVNYGK